MSTNIKRSIGVVITLGIGILLNFLFCPIWNLRNPALYGFLLTVLGIGTVIQLVIQYIVEGEGPYHWAIVGSIAFAVVLLALIIGGLSSSYMFNSSSYQSMLQMQEGDFEKDINPIHNVENISIVDMETAKRVGDRVVGSIDNSTWYEVNGEYNLIHYQGKQYRISPLEYGGFWKYQKAKHYGIPGYVLVDVTTQESQFVKLEDPIHYAPSAYWSFDLSRHLKKQYPGYMFANSGFFEIDEDGNPYYVTAVKTVTIGLFGGGKEESFIITNACTGESKEYKTNELPEWVDHAYDLSYLMRLAANNLSYVHGYWNACFGKTDVINTTYSYRGGEDNDGDGKNDSYFDGYNTTITSDGKIVFFTGLTPANKAETNCGFILANPKTGVITRYNSSGAEEKSAENSAESLVQDLKYVASFPAILNIDGEQTYFMLLKDKAGLVQRYALCNVKNYTKVVQAESLEMAVQLYKEKMGMVTVSEHTEALKKEGKIQNLYQAQLDGCTYYYFTMEDSTDLYMSSIKNSNRQVLLSEGMKVKIEYLKTVEEGVYEVKKIQF